MKTKALDFFASINSFLINFNPSSMGCNEPNQPTFYGPVGHFYIKGVAVKYY